jgi:phasin family protein
MVKQSEPLPDFDVTRFFGDFGVPGFDVEALVSSQRKNVETLVRANRLALDGAQAAFRRHVEIFRQAVEDGGVIAKELVEPGTPQDKLARQAERVKETVERATSNLRELSEIITKSNGDAFDLLHQRFVQVLDEVKDAVAKTVTH